MTMTDVLKEITPLSEKDLFYIVERHKSEFTYPLHEHRDFELNFVEHAAGAQRVVGDSMEEIGEFDLVLIGGEGLQHAWQQGKCTSKDIREITIQFSADLFPESLLSKNQFSSIRRMLERSSLGLSFPMETIMVPPETPGITLARPITMPRSTSRNHFIDHILRQQTILHLPPFQRKPPGSPDRTGDQRPDP